MHITLKTLRLNKNLSCKDVSRKLNITESAYRKYERSARIPKIENIKKLKEIFECSDEEIFQALDYHLARKTKE